MTAAMDTLSQGMVEALRMLAGGDSAVWSIAGLSLRVSLAATVLGALIGLAAGAALAVTRFAGQQAVVAVLPTLLALPSVIVGLTVYLLLSRAGPLGDWGLLFTPTAMVMAQAILVVPLIAALSRRLVFDALADGGEQLRALGAGPAARGALLLLHQRHGVLTVLLTAFGRAISEVGAVMIVGGNIDGVTRVLTTAIALETGKGALPTALALGMVLLTMVGAVHLLIAWLHAARGAPREVAA